MISERAYWLAWQQVEGVGPHRLRRLQEYFGSLEQAWQASLPELGQVTGFSPAILERLSTHRRQTNPVTQAETWAEQFGPHLTPADAHYPPLLLEVVDSPPVLYHRGPLPPWTPAIAIVGTRHATSYGLRWAKKLGFELARAGFLVVSGLASGIDGAAHEGALAAGKPTAAVLGCGVGRCYPSEHQALYERIAQRGVILSEHPRTTPPDRSNFPRRNRVLAGMTRATLVIEAGERSGALITARLAVDYGRDVFILPGNLDNPQAQGTLSLANQGAQLVLGVEDLLQKLGSPILAPLPLPAPPPPDLTSVEQQVLARLTPEPQLVEILLQATELATGDLTAVLLLLELKGLAVQLPGLKYRSVS